MPTTFDYAVLVTQDVVFASRVPCKVVLAQSRCIFGRVVTAFGEGFTIIDKDGEAPSEMNVENIEGKVVSIFKNQSHNLSDGDNIIL